MILLEKRNKKILTEINWHVLFYCSNEVCYTKH